MQWDFKYLPNYYGILLPYDWSSNGIIKCCSVAALDMVVLKFRREGAEVNIVGMNEASETIVDRLGIHDKPGALERLMGH